MVDAAACRGFIGRRSAVACKSSDQCPPELAGLRLNAAGDLVDERGKAINELGATRFDIAVHALRGTAFATPDVSTNERQDGNFIDALCVYPTPWLFQAICSATTPEERDGVAAAVAAVVASVCGQGNVLSVQQASKGNKYVSVRVQAMLPSSTAMNQVVEKLLQDSRVRMAY